MLKTAFPRLLVFSGAFPINDTNVSSIHIFQRRGQNLEM